MTTVLATFPTLQNMDALHEWVITGLDALEKTPLEEHTTALTAYSLTQPSAHPITGVYGDMNWQRFAVGIFFADWACYTAEADRADFARLLSVVAAFPQGFTLYTAPLNNGDHVPVGYTGWYPISENIFELLEKTPQEIKNRGVMTPLKTVSPDKNFGYIFNASVIPSFIGTAKSRTIMKNFASTLQDVGLDGLASVTVSDHGKRISQKFGLSYTGDMTHDGDIEGVYCGRFS